MSAYETFLEGLWNQIHSGKMQNFPNPIALNINLAYTVRLPDRKTHLVWLPYEYTGICYKDHDRYVNVYPYYKGIVFDRIELSHGTDLYKPKTERDFVKKLYNSSWELEQEIEQYREGSFEHMSAADYLIKMVGFVDWLRYYNSAARV